MDAFASIHPVPADWLRNSDLAPFIPAYWRGLIDQQYAANTVRGYLYGVAHFARWARRSRLAVGDVTAENVERFLDGHLAGCTCPQPVQRSRHQLRAALRLLLSSLDHAGVVVQLRIPDPVQEELRRFDDHMHHARGLAQSTRINRLRKQRALSPRTVACYRDSFSLMLGFAEQRLGKPPTAVQLADLDRTFLASFLDHLEQDRHNSVRSRNIRLAAIRSFLKFAARRDIANLHLIEQTLTVPMKRFDRPMVGFLSREQMLSILDIPTTTWLGQRDRLLLTLLYNTGARVSEIVGILVEDIALGEASSLLLRGKGRKRRTVPLWKSTARDVRAWLRINEQLLPNSPLFPTRDGHGMTRANVTQRLHLATLAATTRHPELAKLSVSPHVIRHTTAMHLLQAGVDMSVIALWLGHESPSTTHMYVQADLGMKERALSRLKPPEAKLDRYRPSDTLLRFLQGL